MDTPLERPGRTVEVEGRLEEEEVSMTEWCQVRRKKGQVETNVVARSRGREEYQTKRGQVEKDVAAGSRGWEEYRVKYPHLAFIQRHMSQEEWSARKDVKEWLAGGDGSELERMVKEWKTMGEAYNEKVEKWLRGGGGRCFNREILIR